MRLRLIIGLFAAGLLLALSPVALGEESHSERKRVIDARIDVLQEKIDAARQREGVLTSQIEVVSDKIRALQDDVDAASSRLDQLESVLALHQRKLDRLNQLYDLQTRKLVFLQRQHKQAVARLSKRLVEIYTTDPTSPLSVVLEASSFADLLDQLEYLDDIGRHDKRIAGEVEHAKLEMQETRNATRRTRAAVAATTRQRRREPRRHPQRDGQLRGSGHLRGDRDRSGEAPE
jgi:peptidoglycan hydrolase CwlO-like protein